MIVQLSVSSAALNLKVPQSQRQGHAGAAATSAGSVTISQAARDLLSATVRGASSDSTFAKIVSKTNTY